MRLSDGWTVEGGQCTMKGEEGQMVLPARCGLVVQEEQR